MLFLHHLSWDDLVQLKLQEYKVSQIVRRWTPFFLFVAECHYQNKGDNLHNFPLSDSGSARFTCTVCSRGDSSWLQYYTTRYVMLWMWNQLTNSYAKAAGQGDRLFKFWLTTLSSFFKKAFLDIFILHKCWQSTVETPDPANLIYMCKISDALHCIFECLECFPICTFCFFSNLTNLALKQNKTQTDGENLRTNKKREIEYL